MPATEEAPATGPERQQKYWLAHRDRLNLKRKEKYHSLSAEQKAARAAKRSAKYRANPEAVKLRSRSWYDCLDEESRRQLSDKARKWSDNKGELYRTRAAVKQFLRKKLPPGADIPEELLDAFTSLRRVKREIRKAANA